MPDISMCFNKKCPNRNKCYRFTAIPSNYQSYMEYKPDESGRCGSFMPVWENIRDGE